MLCVTTYIDTLSTASCSPKINQEKNITKQQPNLNTPPPRKLQEHVFQDKTVRLSICTCNELSQDSDKDFPHLPSTCCKGYVNVIKVSAIAIISVHVCFRAPWHTERFWISKKEKYTGRRQWRLQVILSYSKYQISWAKVVFRHKIFLQMLQKYYSTKWSCNGFTKCKHVGDSCEITPKITV